jgi:superfamily I DNA and/or RNA helicase/predicted DNA-binding WGR domain protein
METSQIPFTVFLSTAFDEGHYATDDIIAYILPLIRRVLHFHESGLVGDFERIDAIFHSGHHLDMEETATCAPSDALSLLEDPAWLPGYSCFEVLSGHHDAQTDIFYLGLILGSLSFSLDLREQENLDLFIRFRSNPLSYNERIHPTLGKLITEMTELDRGRRTQDLYDVIRRLQYYRDYDPEKQTDLSQIAGWVNKPLTEKNSFILNKLRNRLFDTSRRNRLLYYKPNMRFVNLTVGSVPMVLHHQSIPPELLFTWNNELPAKISGMKEIVLNKYLRMEDHGYLPSSLDRVRVESRHAIQEYGFSQLKLVIAFLHWHNLKEDKYERIHSPLLLVPVELKKNKKVKEDHYVLKVLDNTAEVNPVLANQLKDLYGIRLPDFIDLEEMGLQQFFQLLKAQIEEAGQGITLRYIETPDIQALHGQAKEIIANYKKRLRKLGVEPGDPVEPRQSPADPLKALRIEPLRVSGDPFDADDALEGGDPFEPDELVDAAGMADKTSGQPSRPQQIDPEQTGPQPTNVGQTDPANVGQTDPGQTFKTRNGEAKAGKPATPGKEASTPYSWELDSCNMVVGNFNYKKMSLVRDYNQVIDEQVPLHTFEALFSDEPRTYPEHHFDLNRTDDWFHVVTADPSQTKAILQSRAGYSYIIQGPPGTGKSQTITNLIADFAARGKSILFVCEKRAALDVVYHRLKQHGLEELCCYIHDSQSDKREFIKNLKQTYENFTGHKMDLVSIRLQRQALVGKMNELIRQLKEYHSGSMAEKKEIGIPVRKLIERILALRQDLVPLTPKEEELLPTYTVWQGSSPVVALLAEALEDSGSEPVFAEHPFSKIHDDILMTDNPYHQLDITLRGAQAKLKEIDALISRYVIAPELTQHIEPLKNLIQFAVILHPLAVSDNLPLASPSSKEAQEFEHSTRHYKRLQEQYRLAMEKNIHWTRKFSEQDVLNSLPVALKNEGAFGSFLSGRWNKLKKQLHQSYDLSLHSIQPSYRSILESLKAEYDAARQVEQYKRELQDQYRLDNLETIWLSLEILHQKKGDKCLESLLRHPDAASLIADLYTMQRPLQAFHTQVTQCLHEPGDLAAIRDDLENILLNLDGLPDFLPTLRSFAGLPSAIKHLLRHLPLTPQQAEAAIARKALHQFYVSNRDFAGIDGAALEKMVFQLGKYYTELQQWNADLIRALVREKFLQRIDLANMASSQLSEEQKKFKKGYNEGRKILENEFGKSKRYKSIRELSAMESGMVLKDIKPIWLMSPYSVSDSLPLDSDQFDVVIFDEASQISLEEGVPAMYRSGQAIIVGDEKQMPPTDFFSARSEDPDDLARIDDEDGDEWLNHDADSLLVQGTRKLNSVLLSWHYRSHYETLISFSNHAFYEGNLFTIPDKTIHHTKKDAIEITGKEDAIVTVDTLFDRSISFHRHINSVYQRRGNPAEAEYIAWLVRELLNKGIPESIGIVAFSQEQQHTIESALDALALQDAGFARLLEEAFTRTENDQFTGLIVKNLENIQGDERDIIIMSVCYGFNASGKMLMNFGPINKKGGEKRLNVLFSRARKHMAVVSSIRHQDITNEYNEGANYLRRFLHYAERISQGDMEIAGTILDRLVMRREENASVPPTTILAQQIKEQVRLLGYEAVEQIGQSDFKCSLAVKASPGDEEYALGILIDDDKHYQNKNLIEQYYQRPAILERFGWRILPVFSKDWLHQPRKVIEQIHKEMQEAIRIKKEEEVKRQEEAARRKEAIAKKAQEAAEKLKTGPGQETTASGKQPANTGQQAAAGKQTTVSGLIADTGLIADADTGVIADTNPLLSQDRISDAGESLYGQDHGLQTNTGTYDHLDFQRLCHRDVAGEKFWEVAVSGNKLVIRWGKTEGKGQIQLKTFPNEAAAKSEMEKLIQQKKGKGYDPL